VSAPARQRSDQAPEAAESMSPRESKASERTDPKRKAGDALYVYCVGGAEDLSKTIEKDCPGAIEADAGIELVSSGTLAAVVSAVPRSDYAEEVLESRLADPEWTAVRAIRHERVVEFFAARAAVVPLRFGAIYFKSSGVKLMLEEREEELKAIIGRLRGREEWGVTIFRDRAMLLKAVTSLSERLRALEARAAAAFAGEAYLLRKEIESSLADEARIESKRVAGLIEHGLAAASDAEKRLRVLKPEPSARGDIVAKMAFLVSRSRFSEFRAAAEQLAVEHGAAGFQIELTGPWPAYNFASEQQ